MGANNTSGNDMETGSRLSNTTKQALIGDALSSEIQGGKYKIGDRLPSEPELRDLVITKVPIIISSICTNGDAAYEDNHLGTQWRIDGDGEFDWASG